MNQDTGKYDNILGNASPCDSCPRIMDSDDCMELRRRAECLEDFEWESNLVKIIGMTPTGIYYNSPLSGCVEEVLVEIETTFTWREDIIDYPLSPKSKRLPKREAAWFEIAQKGLFDEGLWNKIEKDYNLIPGLSPNINKMILKLETPIEYTEAHGDEELDYYWGSDVDETGRRHLLTSRKNPYLYKRLDHPELTTIWGNELIGVVREVNRLYVYLSDQIVKTNKEIPTQIFFSFAREATDLNLVKEYFKSIKKEKKNKKKK